MFTCNLCYTPHAMSTHSIGYIALLRRNAPYRRLWYGQVVSQLGDWFDNVALFTLILDLTDSGQALGLLLVAEFLPSTLVSPFAGVLLDRLSRKWVMVYADLWRAGLVLLLLLVQGPGDVWLLYLAVVLKVTLTGVFEPARSAILPNLVSREDLVAANGLSGATWSAVLAFGAAAGGLVVGTLGVQAAFLIDACSFVLSAWLIAGVPVQETHHVRTEDVPHASGPGEFVAGLRFIVQQRDVVCYTFAKALWSMSGGVLLLLTLYGREIFPLGENGAFSIGLFYMARGVGAWIGPLVAQRVGGSSVIALRRAMGLAYFLSLAGYLWFSSTPWFGLALLAVMVGHMGGSINWVFSTALLQIQVPDGLRGRVFAVEFAALMFTSALSNYVTGMANDAGWSPRSLALVLGLLFIVPGAITTLLLWRTPAPNA